MTPYELSLLIHFYSSSEPFPESKALTDTVFKWLEQGIIYITLVISDTKTVYSLTSFGEVWLNRALNVESPVDDYKLLLKGYKKSQDAIQEDVADS